MYVCAVPDAEPDRLGARVIIADVADDAIIARSQAEQSTVRIESIAAPAPRPPAATGATCATAATAATEGGFVFVHGTAAAASAHTVTRHLITTMIHST